MGKQTDFDYGWNVPEPDYASNDPPTYAPESYDQGAPIFEPGDEQKPDECMGQAICKKCGKFLGYCSEVKNFSNYQQGENMIERDSSNKNQNGRPRRPNQNGLPFLTPKDASGTPQPAKIIAARIEPDNFKQGNQLVALRLEFKGQHWKFSLRPNNPNLDPLCDAWGDDETRWAGQTMTVSTVEDKFDDRKWLQFEPTVAQEKPEVSKGRK